MVRPELSRPAAPPVLRTIALATMGAGLPSAMAVGNGLSGPQVMAILRRRRAS